MQTQTGHSLHDLLMKILHCDSKAGGDPGSPVGGGTNLRFCEQFPKKLHEIAKNLGRRGGAPLDPPL